MAVGTNPRLSPPRFPPWTDQFSSKLLKILLWFGNSLDFVGRQHRLALLHLVSSDASLVKSCSQPHAFSSGSFCRGSRVLSYGYQPSRAAHRQRRRTRSVSWLRASPVPPSFPFSTTPSSLVVNQMQHAALCLRKPKQAKWGFLKNEYSSTDVQRGSSSEICYLKQAERCSGQKMEQFWNSGQISPDICSIFVCHIHFAPRMCEDILHKTSWSSSMSI